MYWWINHLTNHRAMVGSIGRSRVVTGEHALARMFSRTRAPSRPSLTTFPLVFEVNALLTRSWLPGGNNLTALASALGLADTPCAAGPRPFTPALPLGC